MILTDFFILQTIARKKILDRGIATMLNKLLSDEDSIKRESDLALKELIENLEKKHNTELLEGHFREENLKKDLNKANNDLMLARESDKTKGLEIETKDREIQALTSTLDTAKIKISEKEEQLNAENQKLGEVTEKLSRANNENKIEILDKEEQIKARDQELGEMTEELSRANNEKNLLDEKLSDVTATLAEEKEKAKHLLELKAKHESTIGELEDKLGKANNENNDMKVTLKITTENLVEAKAKNDVLDKRIVDTTAEFTKTTDGYEKRISSLDAKLFSEQNKGAILAEAVTVQNSMDAEQRVLEDKVNLAQKKLDAAVQAKNDNEINYMNQTNQVKKAMVLVINSDQTSVDKTVDESAKIINDIAEREARKRRQKQEKSARNYENKRRRKMEGDSSILLNDVDVEDDTTL